MFQRSSSGRSNTGSTGSTWSQNILDRRSANGTFIPENRVAIRDLARMMRKNDLSRRVRTTGRILSVPFKAVGTGARAGKKYIGGKAKTGWGAAKYGVADGSLALQMWRARRAQQKALKKNVRGRDWGYYTTPAFGTQISSYDPKTLPPISNYVQNAAMKNWLRAQQQKQLNRGSDIRKLSQRLKILDAQRQKMKRQRTPTTYTARTTPFIPSSELWFNNPSEVAKVSALTRVKALRRPTAGNTQLAKNITATAIKRALNEDNRRHANRFFGVRKDQKLYERLRGIAQRKGNVGKVANINKAWKYVQRVYPGQSRPSTSMSNF